MIPFARIVKYGNIAPDLKKIKKMAMMNGETLFVLYQNGDLYARGSDATVFGGTASISEFKLIRQNVQMFYCAYGSKCAIVITEDNRWWHLGRRSLMTGQSAGATNDTWTDETVNFTYFALSELKDIALTTSGIVYLTQDDRVYTRGYNNYGEIYSNGSTPVLVYSGVKSIYSCSNVTCILFSNGTLYCGGYNGSGQLGRSTGASSSGGFAPATLQNVRDVVTNGAATYAVNNSNAVYACGSSFLSTNGTSGQWTGFGNITGDIVQTGSCGDNNFASATPQSGLYSAGRNANNTLGTGDLVTHSQMGKYSIGLPNSEVEWVSSSSNYCTFVAMDGKLYAAGTGNSALLTFNINSSTFMEVPLP